MAIIESTDTPPNRDLVGLPDETSRRPNGTVDFDALLRIGHDLIVALGGDPTTDGFRDTPGRFARWWREFIEYDAGVVTSTFDHAEPGQMVVVSGLRVWSVCEHHLLPFWCDITVGYFPVDQILGLSKFARVAHKHAHRPQTQERLAAAIADEITALTGSADVAVVSRGEHLCMTMRGIKTPGVMSSSIVRGCFREDASVRYEFLRQS
ncbi:MAG: cyclohydrolase, partial [Actinomycetota bacterium]|jgi:GTP cyclohydrolase I